MICSHSSWPICFIYNRVHLLIPNSLEDEVPPWAGCPSLCGQGLSKRLASQGPRFLSRPCSKAPGPQNLQPQTAQASFQASPELFPAVTPRPQEQTTVALWQSRRCGERGRLTPHRWGSPCRRDVLPVVQVGIGRLGAGTGAFSPSDATAGPSLVVRGEEPRARAGDTGSSCGPRRFRVPPGNEAREPQLRARSPRALEPQRERARRRGARACS